MRSIQIVAVGLVLLSLGGAARAADPSSKKRLGSEPNSSDPTLASHIQNSVDHYDAGHYELSLEAAMAARGEIERNSAIVYNNICSAHNGMGNYAEGILACNMALQIAPEYERAKRNLELAYTKQLEGKPSVGGYLNLSVVRYRLGAFDASIEAAEGALRVDPRNAIAHNNLCSAHAMKADYDLAIAECKKALEIDPRFERAQNNLAWAKTRKPPTEP